MKRMKKSICRCLVLCFLLTSFAFGTGFDSEAKSGKWRQDKKGWYYSYSDGTYAKNEWLKSGGKWYYFNAAGYMQTGWKKIGGKWYFFHKAGDMAAAEYCQGYWINKDGSCTYPYKASWRQSGNKWWFGDSKGWYAKNSWFKIDGKYYYFDSKGYMVFNEWIGSELVGKNGTWVPDAKAEWADAYEAFVRKNSYDDSMALVYLDEDSIPELFRRNVHYTEIYTYKNGEVKFVTGFLDTRKITYVDHGSLYSMSGDARVEDDQYGHVIGHYTNVQTYSSGTSANVGIGTITKTDAGVLVGTKYQWNGSSITQSVFDQKLASAFAGKYTKTLQGGEMQGTPDQILKILQKLPR